MRKLAIGVAVAALCLGCGGREEPAARGTASTVSSELAEEGGNQAPIVESVRLDPSEPAQGSVVRAVVMARDPDGQRLTLAYRWSVDGSALETSEASLALEGTAKGAEIRVSVTASDGALESGAVEAVAVVIDRPPSLASAALNPQDSVAPGQPLGVRVSAVDPDGDPLDYEYSWYLNGERTEQSGELFATEGLRGGDTIFAEVRASDGANWSAPERTPPVTVGSGHPEITSTPPGFRDDGVFRYEVTAIDPDGDKRLRYGLEEGPKGMAIDSVLGALVWRPLADQHGVHSVRIVVRDSTGLETKQSFSVTVRERDRNAPAEEDEKAPADAAPEDAESR